MNFYSKRKKRKGEERKKGDWMRGVGRREEEIRW
jgi:hypothetical protein